MSGSCCCVRLLFGLKTEFCNNETTLRQYYSIKCHPDMNQPSRNSEASPEHSFYRAVWSVVAEIPQGHVLTYGDVARLAGKRGAARRVSQALRRAPRSMNLPWHRVINAQGRISFPVDSSGWKRQKELLEAEGVVFLNGRVDLDSFGYRGAVDQLLWGTME
jgi:methylated-DNA-protein-cysteine methyltransferase-like protein